MTSIHFLHEQHDAYTFVGEGQMSSVMRVYVVLSHLGCAIAWAQQLMYTPSSFGQHCPWKPAVAHLTFVLHHICRRAVLKGPTQVQSGGEHWLKVTCTPVSVRTYPEAPALKKIAFQLLQGVGARAAVGVQHIVRPVNVDGTGGEVHFIVQLDSAGISLEREIEVDDVSVSVNVFECVCDVPVSRPVVIVTSALPSIALARSGVVNDSEASTLYDVDVPLCLHMKTGDRA